MSKEHDSDRYFQTLRKMLYAQKDKVREKIKQEVDDEQQKLLEQLEFTFCIKLDELKKLEEEAQSRVIPLSIGSMEVRSLIILDCFKVGGLDRSSFVYIKACEAKPDQLHFVEDYSIRVSKRGDTVRVYYMCELGYDPILFKFLSIDVLDRANNNVSSKNRDLKNGVYLLEFKACEEGFYLVRVKVYGENISGSPVRIPIRNNCMLPSEPSLSGAEVPLWEHFQSRAELTLPKLPRPCAEERLTRVEEPSQCPEELEQSQEELFVQSQCFNSTGLAIIQQSEAEEEEAVKKVTLPEAQETCTLDVAGVGLAVRSTNYLKVTSTPKRGFKMGFSAQDAVAPSEETVQSVLEGAAQRERDFMSPVPLTKSPRKKSFTQFSATVSAERVLEFKIFDKQDFLSFPIGITATAEGNIIVGDTRKDRVIVFDAEGRPLCKARMPGTTRFRRPSAIVVLDDGTFAVKDNNCIYLFSKAGEYIRALGKDSLVRPFGLATHSGNDLVTLSVDSPAKLWRFSAAGDFKTSAVYSPLQPHAPAGSKCRFLDVHGDSVFVADLGLSQMYKTDMIGTGLSTFGKLGKRPGAFQEPSGVSAADKCLFIGDSRNNRIQVFDFDGSFVNVVKLPSRITRPSGIHVSTKNKLYVLQYLHGIVGVYDLKFEETEI